MKLLLICSLILLISNQSAHVAESVSTIDISSGGFRGVDYWSEIAVDHLSDSPKWDLDHKLPLKPEIAENLAIAYVEKHFGTEGLGSINGKYYSISETSLVKSRLEGYWYYSISVFPYTAGTGARSSIKVFVTLNGKVVPVRISK